MEYFSESYDEARSRFRDAVQKADGRLHVLELAARGPSDTKLTIDIGWLGAESPQQVLIHSSGIHGVEGFAGSAIQLQLLELRPPLSPHTALICTHVLNPFGMSWLRRANENNVDLNRNFIADGDYSGAPSHYGILDSFLNPKSVPSRDFFLLKAMLLVLRYGASTLLQSIAGGQYEFPKGLFFGGKKLEEGLEKYQAFLKENLASCRRVIAIDVHTGLGSFGKDMLLVRREDFEFFHNVLGSRVTLSEPEQGQAYRIRGGHWDLLSHALPGADVRFVTQEFGTYHAIKVLHALREENRLHHYGASALAHSAKRMLKEVFCPRSELWRTLVVSGGLLSFEEAVLALDTLSNGPG